MISVTVKAPMTIGKLVRAIFGGMKESGQLGGLYYNPETNQTLHWETEFLGFKGKLAKVSYGCAWLYMGTNQKIIGTPIRHDDFAEKILARGWDYVGLVNEPYKEGE